MSKQLNDIRYKKIQAMRKQGKPESKIKAWARGWDSVDRVRAVERLKGF